VREFIALRQNSGVLCRREVIVTENQYPVPEPAEPPWSAEQQWLQQGGAPPGYPGLPAGLPPPGQPFPAARRTSRMAIASLVLGIVAVLFVFVEILPAIPAIILGHAARRKIRTTGEAGRGLALAGLILGYVWSGVWLYLVAVLIVWAAAGGDAPQPAPARPPAVTAPAGIQAAFSPGGQLVAVLRAGTASGPARVLVSDVASGHLITTVTDRRGVAAMAFSPDGKMLATLDVNGSTHVRDIGSGHVVVTLPDPGTKGADRGHTVAFSPDGTTVAASEADGSTYLLGLYTATLTGTLPNPRLSRGVLAVAFSPDGKTVAVGDANGSTYLWNAPNGPWITTMTAVDTGGVTAIAFSPDGKLVAALQDGIAYLWDASSGRQIAALSPPRRSGDTLAFSPDGTRLAEGASNGHIYLWDIATTRVTATLTAPGATGFLAVAFSRDGKTVIASYLIGTGNSTTRRWKIS
jgi:dipeptidyl aminopeptidase/acylaminoacyl peptidase